MGKHEAANTQPDIVKISSQIFPLDQGPIDLSLGIDQQIRVVRAADVHGQDPDNTVLIIDPEKFDPYKQQGFTPIHEGGEVIIGRDHTHGRFTFADDVSRKAVRFRRFDGQIKIDDLDSLNGVFYHPNGAPTQHFSIPEVASEQQSIHEQEFRVNAAAATLASERHPERNEDAYFVDAATGAAGVFDGLGSLKGSAEASRIAAASVAESLAALPVNLSRDEAALAVKNSLLTAREAIVATESEDEIATTAAVVKLFQKKNGQKYPVFAHAGDCRVYLYRDNGVSALTLDHTLSDNLPTEQQAELQEALADATDKTALSGIKNFLFSKRELISSSLSSVPSRDLKVSVADIDLLPGDRLLLTTDGIHDNLTTPEIGELLTGHDDDQAAVTNLVEFARARGRQRGKHDRAKQDDMTAVILSYDEAA